MGRFILDHLGGPNVIIRILESERQRQEGQSNVMGERLAIAGFEGGREPGATECEQPLEVEKVKKMEPPQGLQKRMQPANTLISAQ